MQKKFSLTHVGQQVTRDDLDLMSSNAAHADDVVFSELRALGTLEKVIECTEPAVVTLSNGATGAFSVASFRAHVGPGDGRVDARSAVCAATSVTVPVVPPSGGGADVFRWSLVYAVLTVDVEGVGVSRKVKNPASGVVTAPTVAPWVQPTCAVTVIHGANAIEPADPVLPTIPADTTTVKYIPLAYIGRRNTAAVATIDQIWEVAPHAQLQNAQSGPVTSAYTEGGSLLTPTRVSNWPQDFNRPDCYLPSGFGRKIETLFFACNLATGSESHLPGAVIDTRDWRKRICKWTAYIVAGDPNRDFAWQTATHTLSAVPWGNDGYLEPDDAAISKIQVGMGETFVTNIAGVRDPVVANLALGVPPAAIIATISCDRVTGQLKIEHGSPNVMFFIWMEFMSPHTNAF